MGQLKVKNYLSLYHIQAAAYFARQCWKIETCEGEISQNYDNDSALEHRALVMACIASSVSFLEAMINEWFADAADAQRKGKRIKQLDENTQSLMASLWDVETYARTASTLEKYQAALRLSKKATYQKGENPFQDAKILIELRNALLHFKPEWVLANVGDADQADLPSLEIKLRNKFPVNPFLKDARPLFPTQCMSHGCAQWATYSAISFVGEFYLRMGITNPLDQIRASLKTQ